MIDFDNPFEETIRIMALLNYRVLTIFIIAILLSAPSLQSADRPNVIIIITDDQGYGDLSCHGNPVLQTPHLDTLHSESVRLTDFHVAPTCSPTRAAFLTGHWTNRTGVWHTIMGRSMLRENEVTIGQVFQDSGYATGMFGKWHLGDNYPFRPEDRGFSEVMRHGGGGIGQTPDYWDNAYFDGSYWHNGTPKAVQGFCTDVFFDYARQFIKAQRDAGKPFLAYIATNAPHGPMHAPENFSGPYSQLNLNLANFYGMIANIDENVGQLRRFLDDEGLTNNTLFVFTTDNGSAIGAPTYNAAMRGGKGSQYDGGHRVPFFIYWPKGQLIGGRDVTPITAHIDVLPTLIDLCSLTPPQGVSFDGTSIKPLLLNSAADDWPDRILVTDSQRVRDPIKWRQTAVMTSRWRLIDGKELYDIKPDPSQQTNVHSDHPQIVSRLTAFYDAWWAELQPSFANATAIHLGHPAENPARLTSHDWITSRTTPWNQAHIRAGIHGKPVTGFWNVQIVEDGQYEVRLRRWPEEANLSIDSALAPGAAVPGAKAFRMTPGIKIKAVQAILKIGEVSVSADILPGAKEVIFNITLKSGKTRMAAFFKTENGVEYGAYFAYVKRLTSA